MMLMLIAWYQAHTIVGSLIITTVIDVLMGLLLAFKDKDLNSSVSRVGMLRKVGIGLLVTVGFILEPFAQGVPCGSLTALAFLVSEVLSILENASRLGIPIPAVIKDTLSKLRGESAKPFTVRVKQDELKK